MDAMEIVLEMLIFMLFIFMRMQLQWSANFTNPKCTTNTQ